MVSFTKVKSLVEAKIDGIPNEELYGQPLNENTFVDAVVDKIKAICRTIAEIANKIWQKFKSMCAKVHETITRAGSHPPINPEGPNGPVTPQWGKAVIETVRSKAMKNKDHTDRLEMRNWDVRYIDSLPDKVDRFDRIQIPINGRSTVLTADTMIKTVQEGIDKNIFDLDVLSRYDSAVHDQYPKIFQVRNTVVDEKDIIARSGGTESLIFDITPRLVDDMIAAIETAEISLHNIGVRYKNLEEMYHRAEKDIDRLKLTTPADSARAQRYINMFGSILRNKIQTFNVVNKTHAKIITMRMYEYMGKLMKYANS